MKSLLEALQPLGRALMLPIAVLPVAGLLLRLGQPDLLDIAVLVTVVRPWELTDEPSPAPAH